jgi:hypothetical protein
VPKLLTNIYLIEHISVIRVKGYKMDKTLQELQKLFLEYKNSNDQNAYIAVKECIQIVAENNGK